jgi:glutathionylspermidine amidase/synthetase
MGYKWQCVEFARRWLYLNKGYIFDDVAMAYNIFDLRSVRDIKTNCRLPLNAFANGNKKHPEPGCLLIWNKGGEFEGTGHVAVVTEVTDQYLRIAEQNVGQQIWPDTGDYSRELHAKVTSDGEYWVTCSFGDAEILGWMIQTDQDTYAEPTKEKNPQLFTIKSAQANSISSAKQTWLNVANADEAAFVEAMGGHFLTAVASEQRRYFILSQSIQGELEQATNELHGLFMHATEYVLNNDALLGKFNLPEAILPKIRHSWDNRLNHLITSRFDFCLTQKGLKVY